MLCGILSLMIDCDNSTDTEPTRRHPEEELRAGHWEFEFHEITTTVPIELYNLLSIDCRE